MQDEVVAGAAAVQSLTQLTAPSAADLEAQYRDDPAGTGALCVSHILLKTEAEAQAVVDELKGGADFAEVAKARSTEPAAATTGGALAGADGNACQSVGTFQTQYDADFTAGALGATVGVPTDPITEPVRLARHPPPPVRGGRRRPGQARRQLAGRGRADRSAGHGRHLGRPPLRPVEPGGGQRRLPALTGDDTEGRGRRAGPGRSRPGHLRRARRAGAAGPPLPAHGPPSLSHSR